MSTVSLNGIAHIYITVADLPRCLPFYRRLLAFLDMQCLVDSIDLYYCVGSRTGIGIRAASTEHANTPFDPYRAGLHHVCLRARSNADVERVHDFVVSLQAEAGGRIVHAPQQDRWAPGYYSVLFEDPCGTRLEVNYVPGKGNLDAGVSLPLADDVQQDLTKP